MITEEYISNDKQVIKLIHDDGTESTWKFNQTCDGKERNNKAVLFVSVSYGCAVKCRFCWLTAKKIPYKKINDRDIRRNIIDAIDWLDKVGFDPTEYYFKLSYMGMGDVFNEDFDIKHNSKLIIDYALNGVKFKGIDGVDVCTSLPNLYHDKLRSVEALNKMLLEEINYRSFLNPNHDWTTRTPVRLFISLHSANTYPRRGLIPGSNIIVDICNFLCLQNDENKINRIFHVIFFEGINDDIQSIHNLVKLAQTFNAELRVLRFNKCSGMTLNETNEANFWKIIEYLKTQKIKFKYQESPGSEVLAACGQFIGKISEKVETPSEKFIKNLPKPINTNDRSGDYNHLYVYKTPSGEYFEDEALARFENNGAVKYVRAIEFGNAIFIEAKVDRGKITDVQDEIRKRQIKLKLEEAGLTEEDFKYYFGWNNEY